ncbi:MAG: hypothetical protein AB7S70_12535 [Hyphomicrobium sp.]|uniref:hypothetical protein n=1 Tax=Hyphomicrobium sp. TaxID=82 RepID=UPI003D1201CF
MALVCVLAAAMPSRATEPAGGAPSETQAATDDLGGRWQGRSYELARAEDCGDQPCKLTLDLVRCAKGWCGVEVVGEAHRCGGTALKLDAGTANPGGASVFKGSLALAKGTEPYVVEAYLLPPRSAEDTTEIQIAGDTGGEFRAFRRSFPFNATLARIGDAQCRPDATVSSLLD